ncbi:MAG: endonuclease III, partial [Thermomicrobiaceae bacterium]|nr:endonuclease III [Thermomicrobiaceae bacterium]
MDVESDAARAAKAITIIQRLDERYGRPIWRPVHGPLDELVLTTLSQHTSDTNSERAFASLRSRFPDWRAVAEAETAEIAEAIRSGGLARRKAERIREVVRQVLAEDGQGDLDSLATLPLGEAKARLTALPGVGPKTAACVLLFGLGRPALPVDTHVYRVSRRLGLLDPATTPEEAHERLEALVPPDDVYAFHVNMIRHGRAVSVARRPPSAPSP